MNVHSSLRELLDPATATARFRWAGVDVTCATPDYVRFKPDDTTIIGYLLTTSDGSTGRGYARWCTDVAEADAIGLKAQTLQPTTSQLDVATTRLDERTIFYPFPNDARLRRLRWHTTPRKWKRTLQPLVPQPLQLSGSRSTVEVLRYKPERRVVVAGHLSTTDGHRRSVLIRYTTARHGATMAQLAVALDRAGIATPQPLMQLDDGRVSVDEFVDAADLAAAVAAGSAVSIDVAAAIVGFHAADIAAPCRSAADEFAQLDAGLEGLARWHEPARRATEVLRRQVAETMPSLPARDVLLHGDLHDRNIMIRAQGGPVFIDLERVARGPAAVDLGLLRGAAQAAMVRQPDLSENAVDFANATIENYQLASTHPSGSNEIAWHCAIALAGQALLAARQFEADWEASVETLLDMALAELAGSSAT
jgi:aminoglycoside phosphotransferase (APT) family kinase protein